GTPPHRLPPACPPWRSRARRSPRRSVAPPLRGRGSPGTRPCACGRRTPPAPARGPRRAPGCAAGCRRGHRPPLRGCGAGRGSPAVSAPPWPLPRLARLVPPPDLCGPCARLLQPEAEGYSAVGDVEITAWDDQPDTTLGRDADPCLDAGPEPGAVVLARPPRFDARRRGRDRDQRDDVPAEPVDGAGDPCARELLAGERRDDAARLRSGDR